jgi:hypothetical protein
MHVGTLKIDPGAYDPKHIDVVLKEIQRNFAKYFKSFAEEEPEDEIDSGIKKLGELFVVKTKRKKKSPTDILLSKFHAAIADFENNRDKYFKILDIESLEEHEDDPSAFKEDFKKKCPIIHDCMWSTYKEMDKYKEAFNYAAPIDLLKKTQNITRFAYDFIKIFDDTKHLNADSVSSLGITALSENEDYTAYGVIGNGIKSHFVYKLFPYIFPNRGRSAVYALYYLTDKKTFGFKDDSEFLMIDLKKSITQQNYFYPYDLFSFYALKIYLMLKVECQKLQITLDEKYRYVYVDCFLNSIAQKNQKEIDDLRRNIEFDIAYGH